MVKYTDISTFCTNSKLLVLYRSTYEFQKLILLLEYASLAKRNVDASLLYCLLCLFGVYSNLHILE